jgi:hypothetical protein
LAAGRQTQLFGETVGVLLSQLEHKAMFLPPYIRQDQLHDIARLVFQLHGQVFVAQNGRGVGERLEQLAGRDAVFRIFTYPGLQQASNDAADGAATIHEVALHATDLGHMEMRLNGLAVRPYDCEGQMRRGGKRRFER